MPILGFPIGVSYDFAVCQSNPPWSRVQRSIFRQDDNRSTWHRGFKKSRCRRIDHNVFPEPADLDFSTAASNSALIATTKSLPRVAAPFPACPTAKKE
jgi:hypothetical protein